MTAVNGVRYVAQDGSFTLDGLRLVNGLASGTPASLPPGGTAGQVLTKQSATDGDADWAAASGSVSWADVTGKPAFAAVATSGAYTDLSGLPALFDGAFASLTGIPSTFTPSAHNQAWSTITATPTTLAG
jgi:hypothetical protein